MLGSGVTGVVALCAALVVCASGRDYEKTGVNVRTVLFSAKDLCKSCWSAEDAELLKARMVLQDIIPTRLTTDFPMVLRYLRICLETLNSEVPQIKLKVAKMALYDALGGYLKSIVIPMLDEAYYAGNVGYGVAAELHSIYGQMKAFLQTDGSGWSSPCDMRKIPTKVAPLSLKVCKHREACDALVIAEQSTPNPTMEASTSTASPYERLSEPAQSCEKTAIVPIPYLDDRNYPCSIAIPFRERTLFGLLTMCSANLLPKYYILTMRCLTGRQYTKKQILDFNHQFHAWLVKEVVPHLRDRDRWYPGFGGVMRILETMKQKGLSGDVCGGPEAAPASNPACCEFPLDDPCRYPAWIKVALICGVVLLILLIIIVIFYWVLHCLRRKWADDEFEECDPGDVPRNVLDKMVAMYCHRDANDDDENDRHGSDTSDESPPLDSPRVNKRRNTKENRSKSDEVKYAAYEVPDPTEDELSETSIVGEHK